MKKSYLSWLFITALGLSSCSDVLNQAPDGKMSLDDVWTDNDKVGAYLNTCYKNFMDKNDRYFFWDRVPANICDEAWDGDDNDVNWATPALYYAGKATASSHPFWNVSASQLGANNSNHWAAYFESIHDCNYFLEHIDAATVKSESDRSRWKAEAHLLRAYYYSELLKVFGTGMPLMEKPYNYTDDFSGVKKASYKETVDFIIKDCDEALKCADLPWRITTGSESGRLPKALAYALKSRMSLYAASPLYCDDQNYWQWAYEQNKEAYEGLIANGYKLYNKLYDVPTFTDGTSDLTNEKFYTNKADYDKYLNVIGMIAEYFWNSAEYSDDPKDKETIFQTRNGGGNCAVEGVGAYSGYKCGTCPSQEMVDCFETIPVDDKQGGNILDLNKPYNDEKHENPNFNTSNKTYDKANPYMNRDPRFYADIYFNGSRRYCYWPFAETTECYENYPGTQNIRRHRWIMTYENEPFTGISSISRTRTRTGYYIRKFSHPHDGLDWGAGRACFKEFRLSEVILNYAEAAAHAGHEDVARTMVNLIRERVKMPDIPSSTTGQELINRIIMERRVELAFEEARYYDVRRLHKPDEDLSSTDKWVTAMHITRNADGSFTYKRGQVNGNPRLCYSNKWLKVPIPLNEVNRILAITGENWQNPGW